MQTGSRPLESRVIIPLFAGSDSGKFRAQILKSNPETHRIDLEDDPTTKMLVLLKEAHQQGFDIVVGTGVTSQALEAAGIRHVKLE